MFCLKCGKEIPDGSVACNYCGTIFASVPGTAATNNSKHNDVIKAKIATKEDQIDRISYWGPGIVIFIGIVIGLLLFGVTGIIIGLILIGVGIWWASNRENEKRKLENEIKELEVELE